MLSQLSNNNIDQYFMYCTYKVAPSNIFRFKLIEICRLNISKTKNFFIALKLFGKGHEETFKNIFEYLLLKYIFKPRNFMCAFNISQIKSIKLIFLDCLFHTCFFHFSKQYDKICKNII